ncbi:MAG: DUF4129 domain-containing protein [bacterium]|nr:DUF4129 domain-containing protein [bacterium]
MKLETLAAEVRPRGHWEAIDLGFRLVRPHLACMLRASCVVTLPVFLLVQLLLWDSLVLASLVMWWFKPLWERVHLHVLSRSLFGDTPTVRETVEAFRGYGFRQWLAWLTIRRLSPTRSLDLPITQLEQLDGAERTRRLTVLRRGEAAAGASWLMVVCIHLEGFLLLGGLLLAQLFVPESIDANVFSWFFGIEEGDSKLPLLANNLSYHLAALLVAPFYVGGGFGLYINRRTILEGWDVEIAFRRIADRSSARRVQEPAGRAAVAALLVVLFAGLSLCSAPAGATTEGAGLEPAIDAVDRESSEVDEARERIKLVLAGDAFHEPDTVSVPRFIFDWSFDLDEASEDESWPAGLIALLRFLAEALAWISEFVLVALAVAVLVYCAYRYRDTIAEALGQQRGSRPDYRQPTELLGMDVRPESLPDDVIHQVLELWQRGDKRAAVALLYRATLVELMRSYDVSFAAGSTERDCVRAARQRVGGDCAGYFAALTRSWQLTAYAHRPPALESLEELCARWPHFFRSASHPEGEPQGGESVG